MSFSADDLPDLSKPPLRDPRPVGPARVGRHARNEDLARALWKRSEELTGLSYSYLG